LLIQKVIPRITFAYTFLRWKDMKTDSHNRAIILGEYIAATGATVRQCAKEYGISKSTVHSDVTKRLGRIDRALSEKVRCVLDKNKTERHLRGGEATKRKYKQN
jgi:putative DeoR family transcriptional regulator (stage III sporulation protein D)